MKKIRTKLQLTKTTVRVLRDSALVNVRGGGEVARRAPGDVTDHATVCVGLTDHCGGGGNP